MVSGVLQRLYARYREDEPYLRTTEEEVEGEKIQLVYLHDKATHRSKKEKKGTPLVLVVAGSEGLDNTAKHLMLTAYNLGYRTLAVDPSDLHDRSRMERIARHYRQKYPKEKMFGIGVEYGANLLVNTAADNPGLFDTLVSIGNPFDLAKAEINLQSSWLWRLLYLDVLKGRLRRAGDRLQSQSVSSLFEVDKLIYGLSDEKLIEWKKQQSCINAIPRLQTRTLFLQSHEDPFSQ
jgi:pimeloyl-ACP methyl ester carboxylesterase